MHANHAQNDDDCEAGSDGYVMFTLSSRTHLDHSCGVKAQTLAYTGGPPLDLCSDSLNSPDLQQQAREATKIFRQLAASVQLVAIPNGRDLPSRPVLTATPSQGDSYGTVESSPFNFHYAIGV